CRLINIKPQAEINDQGRTSPPRYRLHAAPGSISAKGVLPFTWYRGVEKGKMPSGLKIFFGRGKNRSAAAGSLIFDGVIQDRLFFRIPVQLSALTISAGGHNHRHGMRESVLDSR